MSLEELMGLEVNVSSTRSENVFNTPSTVTVIDQGTIQRYNFQSVAEALASLAGIEVRQTIIDRNVVTARGILQNFYDNKILFMINGVPTWQPIYGDGDIARVDIRDVERVEVLKGPASVLYGSNAYSGVVNIVLRDFEANTVVAHGEAGLPNLGGSGFNATLNPGNWHLFLSAHSLSDHNRPYAFEGARGSLYNADSVFQYREKHESNNVNLLLRNGPNELMVNHYHYNHSFPGANPSYASGGGNWVENTGLLANYRFDKAWEKLRLVANANYDDFRRRFAISPDRMNTIQLGGYRLAAEAKANYPLAGWLSAELGALAERRVSQGQDALQGMRDTVVASLLTNDVPITEAAFFAQLQAKAGGLTVLGGTRLTQNSLFGSNISSRVSAVYAFNPSNSLKLIFGQAFRVPTLFELYINHPTVSGNQELTPELSTSYELAYLFGKGDFFFQALGFYSRYENLIQRIAIAPGQPNQYQNVSAFEGYGAELELRYQNQDLANFFLNYSHVRGLDEQTDNNYRFVPDHYFNFGVSKPLGDWALAASGTYHTSVEGHLATIDPQLMLNANITWRQKLDRFELLHGLRVQNLTGSQMLTAEYIRQTPNINAIPTTGFGTKVLYTLVLKI